MGSRFEITLIAENQKEADYYTDLAVVEISRIELLISSWDENSLTSEINRKAGLEAVKVSDEYLNLIQRAIKISELTDGAFDISYASMDKIWFFDGSMKQMPEQKLINKSVEKVGYKKIQINEANKTIFLTEEGMKIGFGAIGKGYAADRVKAILTEKGIEAGIINASGDMSAWGKQLNGEPWKVAITNPMDKSKAFGLMPIREGAVVTSGNYEKYVEFNGIRYAHIINPKTGYPSEGILSVTIFAAKAELADALATAVFVMGIESGLDRINQLPAIECIIIDQNGNIHKSKNIEIEH